MLQPLTKLNCVSFLAVNNEVIDLLISAGADINGYGERKVTPLTVALWCRNIPLVQLLFGMSYMRIKNQCSIPSLD